MAKKLIDTLGLTTAQAIQLLKLHNPIFEFRGFADTTTAIPDTLIQNYAWIVTETGLVMGLNAEKGQVVYVDRGVLILKNTVNLFNELLELKKYISLSCFLDESSANILVSSKPVINFSKYIESVTIEVNNDETLDISGVEIYLTGYVRQSGSGSVKLYVGSNYISKYPSSFSGTFLWSFAFPFYTVTIQFKEIPIDLFTDAGYFQKSIFNNNKIVINQYKTINGIVYNVNNIEYQASPTWVSNGAYRYISIKFANNIDKLVSIKLSQYDTDVAFCNFFKNTLYPSTITDYEQYVVIDRYGLKNLRQQIDYSKPLDVVFVNGMMFIMQDEVVLYSGTHNNSTSTDYFTIGAYNSTTIVEYILIRNINEFKKLNIQANYNTKVLGRSTFSKLADFSSIIDFNKDIEIPLRTDKNIGQRIFEAAGGEVVSGLFGTAMCVYRIKMHLNDEYRIKMKYRFTKNLLRETGLVDSYLMRTEQLPDGLTVPDSAFSLKLSQNIGSASRIFLRGYGNYIRETDLSDSKGYGSFSVRFTGTPSLGVNYTLTINETNFIIKNGTTELLNLLKASYDTQHDLLKAAIAANLANVKFNIMALRDSVDDWIYVTNEPLVIDSLDETGNSVKSAFPVWVYNSDYNWHIAEIISNPNSEYKFYYRHDGEVIFPIDWSKGQTSEIFDWIYFGGHDNNAAPIEIESIKISKNTEEDEPKIMVLMFHSVAGGLCYDEGEGDGYYHTSAEHIFKYKQLLDELGYVYTDITQIRDYGKYGLPLPAKKCWCMVFDDQQDSLWTNEDFRQACFEAGIKPVTAVITGWIEGDIPKENMRRASGHGWKFVSHSHNHTLGDRSYEVIKLHHGYVQQFFMDTFNEECDIIVYPGGNFSEKVIETLTSLGYALGLTTNSILLNPFGKLPMSVTRIDASESSEWSVLENLIRRKDML